MDKTTRNTIERTTQQARKLLDEDFSSQLEGTFDVLRSGVIAAGGGSHLSALQQSQREKIVAAIEHKCAAGMTSADAVTDYVRDAAFTTLNRFVALKMLEARELVQECITKGEQSAGYHEFCGMAPGITLLPDAAGYRLYIESLFDEFSTEIRVLFDRRDAASALWPKRATFNGLLEVLNSADLADVWGEDETVGWIYQYYNGSAERRKMRDESAAPRNSRELAVRNQFFTPRYVVEFLTDNTLGRIWYEMTQGESRITHHCRYLVRRPNEVFLQPGVAAPAHPQQDRDRQDQGLQEPVHIKHRPLKDPRDIRILDPACGSMHFGLYAFDLLQVIYDEAWEIARSTDGAKKSSAPFAPFVAFALSYRDKATFMADVPRLIIENNLHGIDIDLRAVQIAGLSLWLRAQRAWQQQGLRLQDRPSVRRSNIVCAEPMPGEAAFLAEFIETHFSANAEGKLLGQLLRGVFDAMKLAGEAGSLLKVEEDVACAVAEAKKKWLAGPKMEQTSFFPGHAIPAQKELGLDVTGITDDTFWERAEERIYAALETYAEQAEHGGAYQRRLFADDAARGFAFIDLCRQRYDVVLMNPPFGEAALATRDYIASKYGEAKEDIYAAFVSRFAKTLEDGALGVISNRTGFFLSGAKRWRESTLLSSPSLAILADLGDGVLDDALVEAAAYVIRRSDLPCVFFRLLDQQDKGNPLLEWVSRFTKGQIASAVFLNAVKAFYDFPESRISYWAPPSVREIYRTLSGANGSGLEVKFGLSTKDDYRFLRLCWEVPQAKIVSEQDHATREHPWMYLAKGGEYSLHFADIHLVANWASRGNEIAARVVALYPYLNGDANWVLHTEVPYGQPGVTYTKRTTSGFSPRFLPPGCLISDLGCTVFADDNGKLPRVLAIYGSRAFGYLLEFNVASGDSVHSGSAARHYEIGTVASVPIPPVANLNEQAGEDSVEIWRRKAIADGRDEVSRYFVLPWPTGSILSLRECAVAIRNKDIEGFVEILSEASEAENAVRSLYGFDDGAREACDSEFGPDVTSYPTDMSASDQELLQKVWSAGISQVVGLTSDALGFARFISKMTFIADRRLELLCHRFHSHPQAIFETIRGLPATRDEAIDAARSVCSYSAGTAFGRWDIRIATGESAAQKQPDPTTPLPVCPPGLLQNEQGLPVTKEEMAKLEEEGRSSYPTEIPWDGILVDDPGHRLDIEIRVRKVLQIIWPDRWESIEREACDILGVHTLRDYFRKPAGFFSDHLKRYSKSRRQAPIYWPLSTLSGSYTIWLYYHRFSQDTLYQAAALAKEKLAHEERRIGELVREHGPNPGATQRKEQASAEAFVAELRWFHDEIARVAPLWRPDPNDGAVLIYGPLWRMAAHRPWQKTVKEDWDALCNGDYDWAHLAMHLWPERVVPKCASDRSLAIAHGLESVFWVDEGDRKWKPGRAVARQVDELVRERTSVAVKAALRSLLEAPVTNGNGGRGRGRGRRVANAVADGGAR